MFLVFSIAVKALRNAFKLAGLALLAWLIEEAALIGLVGLAGRAGLAGLAGLAGQLGMLG